MSCRVWIVPSTNSAFTMSGRMLSTYGATALAHGPSHLGKDKGTPRSPDNFSSCLRKAHVGAMTHKCHHCRMNCRKSGRNCDEHSVICVFTTFRLSSQNLNAKKRNGFQFQSIRLFSIPWVYHVPVESLHPHVPRHPACDSMGNCWFIRDK